MLIVHSADFSVKLTSIYVFIENSKRKSPVETKKESIFIEMDHWLGILAENFAEYSTH